MRSSLAGLLFRNPFWMRTVRVGRDYCVLLIANSTPREHNISKSAGLPRLSCLHCPSKQGNPDVPFVLAPARSGNSRLVCGPSPNAPAGICTLHLLVHDRCVSALLLRPQPGFTDSKRGNCFRPRDFGQSRRPPNDAYRIPIPARGMIFQRAPVCSETGKVTVGAAYGAPFSLCL